MVCSTHPTFLKDADYPWPDSSPQADLAEARRIIEATHYHRRLEELHDAESALM